MCLKYMNYENILFAIHELWNHENICLQYMNYEICKYCTLETLGLWKYKKFYLTHDYEKIKYCLQYIIWKFLFAKHEYEIGNICIIWIMKKWNGLFAIHE